jgi:hypothetical protein
METGHGLAKSPDSDAIQPDGISVRGRHEPAGPESNPFAGLLVILLIVASVVSGTLAAGLPRPVRQVFEIVAVLSLSGAALTAWRAARRLAPVESEARIRGEVARMKRAERQRRTRRGSGRQAA